MPRQARLDVPGALHHIMVRGINKSPIFKDGHDRARFLERLGRTTVDAECAIYAWVLMDNHVHLLFKSGRQGISAVMRKLLTWYAQYFNRRHRRTGHLFENRYKSVLCDEDAYLLALVRYIHLNPVRAKMVTTLEEMDRYPWSGHRAIIGKDGYAWMDTGRVLAQFGTSKRKALREYRRFIAEGMEQGRIPELTGGGRVRTAGGWSQVVALRRRGRVEESDERILGSGDFVTRILKEAEEHQLRQTKLKRAGASIHKILEEECRKRQISPIEVQKGRRRRPVSEARAAIAYRSRVELGLSAAEMARHLGVNTSCITRAIARLEARE